MSGISEPGAGPQAVSAGRIASLDQFRGYTVVGMLLVNFIGGFNATLPIFKHHNTYCSYADTIMPQFFFAVGFAYRLTFLRRRAALGMRSASSAVVRRCLGLILIGLVMYHLDGSVKTWEELKALGVRGFFTTAFAREPFQTLVHIALTSLWILPVIGARPLTRAVFLTGSAGIHLWLSSRFYFEWAWTRPVIDGGPLGFLSWTIPTLVGSLAYDAIATRKGGEVPLLLTAWSLVLMGLGYGLSCVGGMPAALPFWPANRPVDLWTMSQRTGSISYLTFSAGFSLLVYAAFVVACDWGRLRVGLFRTFGTNALAAYILHGMVAGAVKPYVPSDSPGGYVAAAFGLYLLINYVLIRGLEKEKLFLRL
jgi:predicted acyltransferase